MAIWAEPALLEHSPISCFPHCRWDWIRALAQLCPLRVSLALEPWDTGQVLRLRDTYVLARRETFIPGPARADSAEG